MLVIDLTGPDGNTLAIAAIMAGVFKQLDIRDEIPVYREKVLSGDYENVLEVTGEYLDMLHIDYQFIRPEDNDEDDY